jgi:putative ABC transport system permease protein
MGTGWPPPKPLNRSRLAQGRRLARELLSCGWSFESMNDLRAAFKSLHRTPGFTLVAIATLALGLGASTSLFSVLNGYLLPVPYVDGDRLDRIFRTTPRERDGGFAPADYLELKREVVPYGEVAAYAGTELNLSEPGRPAEMIRGLRASANLFPLLGEEVALGRGFRAGDEIAGNHRVLVISHRVWQNRFGGDPRIVGRTVRVDGEPWEIVGVLPATFSDWRHLEWVDVFRPLAFDEKEAGARSPTTLRLIGRRARGVSASDGAAFMAELGRRLAAEHPAEHQGATWRTVQLGDTFLPGTGRIILRMVVGLSGFVVLLACSNLANLFLARTMVRAREFAVRAALGASRWQMLRPLLFESLLLSLAGGAVAVFVARWTFDWYEMASRGDTGVGIQLALDWRILAWTSAACLFTAVAFGAMPALFASRLDVIATLKSSSRGSTGDRRHRRFRHALIVGQFALAMVLLAGAALFARALHELNGRRQGWESAPLVTGNFQLPVATYAGDEDMARFHELLLQKLEALPGVTSASISYEVPFFDLAGPRSYVVAGREVPPPGQEPSALFNGVSPRYFETFGTPVLRGRVFGSGDRAGAPPVYVINESMARGLFGEADAIGQRISPAGPSPRFGEIVGVVADVRPVTDRPSAVRWQVYLPLAQEPRRMGEIAVRTSGVDPATVVDGVRQVVMSVDVDLPVRRLGPADERIARANYQLGVLGRILGALGGLGLGLAALGIYGVVSRTTVQRRPEFGIRLALGAQASDIARLVLTSGAKLAGIGCALGLLGAFVVSRLLAMGFPGMQLQSPGVLLGVTLLLVAVGQVACWLPARQVTRLSPAETLRAD